MKILRGHSSTQKQADYHIAIFKKIGEKPTKKQAWFIAKKTRKLNATITRSKNRNKYPEKPHSFFDKKKYHYINLGYIYTVLIRRDIRDKFLYEKFGVQNGRKKQKPIEL
jgi:hypothetical protein